MYRLANVSYIAYITFEVACRQKLALRIGVVKDIAK
jgi:hypothetical protein